MKAHTPLILSNQGKVPYQSQGKQKVIFCFFVILFVGAKAITKNCYHLHLPK